MEKTAIMVRRIMFLGFILFVCAGAVLMAAGRADVADAVMKRDKAALRALPRAKGRCQCHASGRCDRAALGCVL